METDESSLWLYINNQVFCLPAHSQVLIGKELCQNVAEHDSLSPSFKFVIKIQVEVTLTNK
jgi:hypothetical protein